MDSIETIDKKFRGFSAPVYQNTAYSRITAISSTADTDWLIDVLSYVCNKNHILRNDVRWLVEKLKLWKNIMLCR